MITGIALMLEKIATLWQIPNWSMNNSVLLAGWIFENYPNEPLEVIINCLKNPPVTEDKIYRLTPDVITQWMVVFLEKEAVKRETENNKLKEGFKQPLTEINYESFKKRLAEGTALQDKKEKSNKDWVNDTEYQEFKNRLIAERAKNKEPEPKKNTQLPDPV